MRIELPSGSWVEVKDNMTPGDRFAVMDAAEVVIEDGKSYIRGASSGQWKAFLTRVVTDWSYSSARGVPVPSAAGPQVLDEYPDSEDDIEALEDALQARYERIVRRRPTARKPPSTRNETSSG